MAKAGRAGHIAIFAALSIGMTCSAGASISPISDRTAERTSSLPRDAMIEEAAPALLLASVERQPQKPPAAPVTRKKKRPIPARPAAKPEIREAAPVENVVSQRPVATYRLVVDNLCPYPVRYAVYYYSGSEWLVSGWWNLAAGSIVTLNDGVNDLMAAGQPFYYRFEELNGRNPLIGADKITGFQDTIGVSVGGSNLVLGLSQPIYREYSKGFSIYRDLKCPT